MVVVVARVVVVVAIVVVGALVVVVLVGASKISLVTGRVGLIFKSFLEIMLVVEKLLEIRFFFKSIFLKATTKTMPPPKLFL